MSEPIKPGEPGQLNADFIPVEDEKETAEFLKESASTLSSVMLWTKNQEKVLQTHVSAFFASEKSIYLMVPPGEDPKGFAETLTKIGISECYFSVSSPRANIFFKAPFLGFDDLGLKFRHPVKIFKVQRRRDFRFLIPDGHILRVEFQDPIDPNAKVRPKVLDISAGGLAFLASDSEVGMFTIGLTLHNVTFSIKGRKICVDAEVRHKRALPQGFRQSGHKIGVLFKDLKPSDNQHIAAYVFEESRKYFSRFI